MTSMLCGRLETWKGPSPPLSRESKEHYLEWPQVRCQAQNPQAHPSNLTLAPLRIPRRANRSEGSLLISPGSPCLRRGVWWRSPGPRWPGAPRKRPEKRYGWAKPLLQKRGRWPMFFLGGAKGKPTGNACLSLLLFLLGWGGGTSLPLTWHRGPSRRILPGTLSQVPW